MTCEPLIPGPAWGLFTTRSAAMLRCPRTLRPAIFRRPDGLWAAPVERSHGAWPPADGSGPGLRAFIEGREEYVPTFGVGTNPLGYEGYITCETERGLELRCHVAKTGRVPQGLGEEVVLIRPRERTYAHSPLDLLDASLDAAMWPPSEARALIALLVRQRTKHTAFQLALLALSLGAAQVRLADLGEPEWRAEIEAHLRRAGVEVLQPARAEWASERVLAISLDGKCGLFEVTHLDEAKGEIELRLPRGWCASLPERVIAQALRERWPRLRHVRALSRFGDSLSWPILHGRK